MSFRSWLEAPLTVDCGIVHRVHMRRDFTLCEGARQKQALRVERSEEYMFNNYLPTFVYFEGIPAYVYLLNLNS